MTENLDFEKALLLKVRSLLIDALEEEHGIKITGHGFGSGQGDIDVAVDGRNYCITMTLSPMEEFDAHLDEEEIIA